MHYINRLREGLDDHFPTDITDVIISFLWECDVCHEFCIGDSKSCVLCCPDRKLCEDCYDMLQMNCLETRKCFVCQFCGKWHCQYHSHYYWIDWSSLPETETPL